MDIQKEREAFLNYIKKEYPLTYGDISDSIDVMHHFNKEFNAWIEAKAQAVPKGFVLIPKKMPDEVNDQLWDFMTDNFVCVNDYGDSFMACDDFNLEKFYAELVSAQEPK